MNRALLRKPIIRNDRRPRVSRRKYSGQALRDSIIFGVGIFGILYETIIEKVDRPTLVVLFAGMVGLPAFLRGDDFFNDKREDEDDPDQSA